MAVNIQKFIHQISGACQQFGVASLDLFGSATTSEFSEKSDLDFLVEFLPHQKDLFGKFLNLKRELEKIFSRKVDLVSKKGIRNPIFKESIMKTRKNVYPT